MTTLSIGQRVVMHLDRFKTLDTGDVYNIPWDLTQDGIAAALRISRAHASIELKKLKDAGKVDEKLSHVKNGKVKRKTYFLTPLGLSNVSAIVEFANKERIDIASLLDMKRQDPVILLEELSKEDRFALGCACAFGGPVPVSVLPPTKNLTIPSDVNGNTVISDRLRENILNTVDDDERAQWHGFAANYWLDRKIKRSDDYYECIHELLYHYIESGRNFDACKLVSGELYYFINSIDDQLYDLLKKIKVIKNRRDVFVSIIETCLEYDDYKGAEDGIRNLSEYDENAALTYMFDLEMKRGDRTKAVGCIEAIKDDYPMAGIRWASVLREDGRYDDARKFVESIKGIKGTEYDNFALEKFVELARIDSAEGRYGDAYQRLCKARATVNNKTYNKRFNSLERELKARLGI